MSAVSRRRTIREGATRSAFILVAILFVIFDVETIFLLPWAIQYDVLGLFGLVEMLVFLAILIAGYIWLFRQRALKWA